LSSLKKDAPEQKKEGAELNLSDLRYWYTLYTDKRAHARVVSHSSYHLVANLKSASFLIRDSKRMLLMFYLLKYRKITLLRCIVLTNIENILFDTNLYRIK